MTVDVGEAEIAALKPVGELFVVEPEEVKDGGLEVMDVDWIALDAVNPGRIAFDSTRSALVRLLGL